MTYPHTGWQDLQPGASETHSSQPSREKLWKTDGSPTWRVTRPLTRLKSNLRWFHVIFSLQHTTILPLHRQGLASYAVKNSISRQPIHITTSMEHCIEKGNIHDYTKDTPKQCKIRHQRKAYALKKNKNNCHSYKAYTTKIPTMKKKSLPWWWNSKMELQVLNVNNELPNLWQTNLQGK